MPPRRTYNIHYNIMNLNINFRYLNVFDQNQLSSWIFDTFTWCESVFVTERENYREGGIEHTLNIGKRPKNVVFQYLQNTKTADQFRRRPPPPTHCHYHHCRSLNYKTTCTFIAKNVLMHIVGVYRTRCNLGCSSLISHIPNKCL